MRNFRLKRLISASLLVAAAIFAGLLLSSAISISSDSFPQATENSKGGKKPLAVDQLIDDNIQEISKEIDQVQRTETRTSHFKRKLSKRPKQRVTTEVIEETEAFKTSEKSQFRQFVHFDLKGAPPKVDYLLSVFEFISKKLGATGVLLEWEDMFPYTGVLKVARNGRAYTKQEVQLILETAKALNLQVVPLIQTFGHLEWILKLKKFAHLREISHYSQTICVSKKESIELIKNMIDQIMNFHTDAKMLHIGMDEAFQVGDCNVCSQAIRSSKNGSKDWLITKHMATIAEYAKKKYGVRVLVWHDMLKVSKRLIEDFQLSSLVEPVVWNYQEQFDSLFTETVFNRFVSVFKRVWAGSAFKGANRPDSYFVANSHYLLNHLTWLNALRSETLENYDRFQGFMITGWSRYDHFAVLCELFPAAVPSLTINMLTVQAGNYSTEVLEKATESLHCATSLSLNHLGYSPVCKFPGSSVYQLIMKLQSSRRDIASQIYEHPNYQGWMSSYNLKNNYSSSWYLDQIIDRIIVQAGTLRSIGKQLRTELEMLYYTDTVDEFLFQYYTPEIEGLDQLLKNSKRLASLPSFPVRPLMID